jgi:hypothetical protein
MRPSTRGAERPLGRIAGARAMKDVNLLVQLRVNAQGSKRLGSALAETDVAETGCTGDLEDMFDRVRDVVPRKVINGKVPKLVESWGHGGSTFWSTCCRGCCRATRQNPTPRERRGPSVLGL